MGYDTRKKSKLFSCLSLVACMYFLANFYWTYDYCYLAVGNMYNFCWVVCMWQRSHRSTRPLSIVLYCNTLSIVTHLHTAITPCRTSLADIIIYFYCTYIMVHYKCSFEIVWIIGDKKCVISLVTTIKHSKIPLLMVWFPAKTPCYFKCHFFINPFYSSLQQTQSSEHRMSCKR